MIVEALPDVRRARLGVPLVGRRRISGVTLHVARLDAGEARRLQDRMNARLTACGCAEGAATVVCAAVFAVVLLALAAPDHGLAWIVLRGLAVIPLLAAAAIAGKGVGLLTARIRFHRLCGTLARRLRATADVNAGKVTAGPEDRPSPPIPHR
jgi:hypothetical protein